jgi:DNA polymerase-4
VKGAARRRQILHVDLDPFFVSVERSLDASLKDRPVIVGGDAASAGRVAAASAEARAAGVRVGQSLAAARALCPDGVFRPGDLEAYAAASDQVTAILLTATRRVERSSSDEAFADLTPDSANARGAVAAAEGIKDEIQRRLGLDASLGVAGSRLAARVASSWARPRGLLIVIPGYEASFLARQSISFLPELPPHLESALEGAGLSTLGQVADADPDALAAAVGAVAAPRLQEAARGHGEEPIAVAAPPSWIQEEAKIRARGSDRAALEVLLDGLATRAVKRLRPFGLQAGMVTVEVRRGESSQRRAETLQPGLADEETARHVARTLAEPLLEPAAMVKTVQLRLTRLAAAGSQSPLFPGLPGLAR